MKTYVGKISDAGDIIKETAVFVNDFPTLYNFAVFIMQKKGINDLIKWTDPEWQKKMLAETTESPRFVYWRNDREGCYYFVKK